MKATERSGVKALRELLVTVLMAALVFLVIQATLRNFQVEGFSMQPTLEDGEFLLVNKAVYARYNVEGWMQNIPFVDRDGDGVVQPFHEPARGEVIVLKAPDGTDRNLIKRIIGVPGDTVAMQRGAVFINGVRLDESEYIDDPGVFSMDPVHVPEGEFWVMGDNRTGSSDSRSFGTVPRENIVGKAWFAYWPFSNLGLIQSHTPDIPVRSAVQG